MLYLVFLIQVTCKCMIGESVFVAENCLSVFFDICLSVFVL